MCVARPELYPLSDFDNKLAVFANRGPNVLMTKSDCRIPRGRNSHLPLQSFLASFLWSFNNGLLFLCCLFVLLMLLIFIFIPQFFIRPKYMHFGYHNHKYDFRTSNPQILQTVMRIKTCGITFHVGNTVNILYRVLTSLFHCSILQISGKGILSMRSRLTGENPVHKEIKRSASLGYS